MFSGPRGASSSAFRPYLKTSGDASSDNSCESPTEVSDSAKASNSPSPRKAPATHHDYSVEKLLRVSSSPQFSESSAHIPDSLSAAHLSAVKSSGIPFEIIAQHLWWQRQQQLRATLPVEDVATRTLNEAATQGLSLFGNPQLRRFFGSPNHVPSGHQGHRQQRGPRRQRTTFTHEQTLRLEMEYHVSEYISRGKRFQLAELLELTENQIKIWFQNRRAKDKRIEKAIVEQQYRYLSVSSSPLPQLNLANCTTCNYTKHQFAGGSGASTSKEDSPSRHRS